MAKQIASFNRSEASTGIAKKGGSFASCFLLKMHEILLQDGEFFVLQQLNTTLKEP